MKKVLIAGLLCFSAAPFALATWKEYPFDYPPYVISVTTVAVNAGGCGYALTAAYTDIIPAPLLELKAGVWTKLNAPPTPMARISIANDNTLYATDQNGSGVVYRFVPPNSWLDVGIPVNYGFSRFNDVAAVSVNAWWATADGSSGDGVVYFEAGHPAKVWNLGETNVSSHYIIVPQTGNPSGEAYVMMKVWSFSYNSYRWALFVLKPTGGYSQYWVPVDSSVCDGLAAYVAGEVRFILTPNAGGPSYLYSWKNGAFTQLQTFPERVVLQCYTSPSEGWGTTYGPKVYHWSDGGFTDTETLNGTVKDLDMVSAYDGWAVGNYGSGSSIVPRMWHYTSGAAVVPTSLGRVKAAFK